MRKFMVSLLVFIFSFGLVLHAADQPDKPKLSNKPEKKAGADRKIRALMKQYKVMRSKTERLMASFRNVHGVLGTTNSDNPLDRENAGLVIIRPTLGVLKEFLAQQTDKGHGDLDYWTRTHSLNRMQGEIACAELGRILEDCGQDMSPLLRAAIKNVLSNLKQGMSKYNNGYGTIEYWTSASGYVRDCMHQAAENIDQVLGALPSVANEDPMGILRAHTRVIANILHKQGDKGHGDIDYWIRTHSILGRQCSFGAQSLRVLLGFVGGKIMPLLRNSVQNVIDNLDATARKYSGGYGDISYWTGATSYVRDGMHRGAADLRQILDSI